MEKDNNMNEKDKIIEIINNIKPYLNMDGGDIEFVDYKDHYIYVKVYGACTNCIAKDDDINEGLLIMFQEEIPEVKGVINVPL